MCELNCEYFFTCSLLNTHKTKHLTLRTLFSFNCFWDSSFYRDESTQGARNSLTVHLFCDVSLGSTLVFWVMFVQVFNEMRGSTLWVTQKKTPSSRNNKEFLCGKAFQHKWKKITEKKMHRSSGMPTGYLLLPLWALFYKRWTHLNTVIFLSFFFYRPIWIRLSDYVCVKFVPFWWMINC